MEGAAGGDKDPRLASTLPSQHPQRPWNHHLAGVHSYPSARGGVLACRTVEAMVVAIAMPHMSPAARTSSIAALNAPHTEDRDHLPSALRYHTTTEASDNAQRTFKGRVRGR